MMRGYFVDLGDGEGFGVVAESVREAKKLAYKYATREFCDVDFIDLSVRWQRAANIEGLEKGIIDDGIIGLKAGLFGYAIGETCPICGDENCMIRCEDGLIGCDDCLEESEPE